MPFSTLFLSGATVGMTTLAFAIATPASAQEPYAHKHYAHPHYAHARYHHYEGRYIVVHAQQPVVVQSPGLRLGARGGGRQCRGRNRPGRAGSFYRRGRGCERVRGRSVRRHGGAVRLPAELHIRRSFGHAVQCGGDSGRSAVPGGEHRFRSAGPPPRLLSRFRLYLSRPSGWAKYAVAPISSGATGQMK